MSNLSKLISSLNKYFTDLSYTTSMSSQNDTSDPKFGMVEFRRYFYKDIGEVDKAYSYLDDLQYNAKQDDLNLYNIEVDKFFRDLFSPKPTHDGIFDVDFMITPPNNLDNQKEIALHIEVLYLNK